MQTKNILIAPLNWGLGHATRCVPIINDALRQGHRVILAADGLAFHFFKSELPDLTLIKLGGYSVRYAPKPWFMLILLLQMPAFYLSMWREHFRVKKIIRQFNIDQIISDNRYGLWNSRVESIILTHQPFVKLPKGWQRVAPMVHFLLRKWIERFHGCWIPDFENKATSLAGELSHGAIMPCNAKFIGPLSRFQNSIESLTNSQFIADVFIILSGPEPHRTAFEKAQELRFANSKKRVLMVTGKPHHNPVALNLREGILKVPHLDTETFYHQLKNAPHIIARSGYSTLMDLHAVDRTAELIPTPGQTEQEYLAQWYYRNSENEQSIS